MYKIQGDNPQKKVWKLFEDELPKFAKVVLDTFKYNFNYKKFLMFQFKLLKRHLIHVQPLSKFSFTSEKRCFTWKTHVEEKKYFF